MIMGAKRHIVFLDRETLPDFVTVRGPSFDHEWTNYPRSSPDQIVDRAQDAEIVVTNKVPLNADTIAALPQLKMIAVAATGTNIINLDACRGRGITVSNIRGYATSTVPEHTIALVLGLCRSLTPYHQSVGQGRWADAGQFCYFDYPIFELRNKVMGIIGAGELGKSVGRLAEAFGMDVRYAARRGDHNPDAFYTPFEKILSESDIISLHCPLTYDTKDLISTPEFDQMAKCPLLINTSRGGLVDELALVDAIEAGKISGAGFDGTTTEPMPDDHPFMRIMDRPNFILTPHVAWASREALQVLSDQLIDNIEAFVNGSPQNEVI
jgi:glycerate dehydrogenase